ncbi:hypothetical protein [uncultured Pseudokineococcus sp.]|uniref:hypothetical protein n=1 Tax=uncultured Pseudokineococcus sp. TaxID=1642928 RepID=UPI00262BE05C|nr:hypothetical protein [uncultured Pseudokineococcus sp.]
MTNQPLFDTAAVDEMSAATRHLQRTLEGARHEDQRSTLEALEALAAAQAAAGAAEVHLVREARRQHATWHQIAAALGVTRQGAAARFRPRGIS